MLSPMGSIFKFARGLDHSGKGAAALPEKACLPRGTYFYLGVSGVLCYVGQYLLHIAVSQLS